MGLFVKEFETNKNSYGQLWRKKISLLTARKLEQHLGDLFVDGWEKEQEFF